MHADNKKMERTRAVLRQMYCRNDHYRFVPCALSLNRYLRLISQNFRYRDIMTGLNVLVIGEG